jgi:hypothetical protein
MSKVPDSLTSFQMLAASLIDNERISKGGWCFEIADYSFLGLIWQLVSKGLEKGVFEIIARAIILVRQRRSSSGRHSVVNGLGWRSETRSKFL